MTLLRKFLISEDGAVTVDWVVLTAAIILMALLVNKPTASSIVGAGEQVRDQISSAVETLREP